MVGANQKKNHLNCLKHILDKDFNQFLNEFLKAVTNGLTQLSVLV